MNIQRTVAAAVLAVLAGTSLIGQAQPGAAKPSLYTRDITALLIVDPYNDFMSEGCKMYKQTLEAGRHRRQGALGAERIRQHRS